MKKYIQPKAQVVNIDVQSILAGSGDISNGGSTTVRTGGDAKTASGNWFDEL